jgi:hypothetical protein
MKVTFISLFLLALTGNSHAQDSVLERQARELHFTMAMQLNALRQELVDLKTVPPFSAAVVQQTRRLINMMGIAVQRYGAEMEVLISTVNTRTEKDSLYATQQLRLREASLFLLAAKDLAEKKREEAYEWVRNSPELQTRLTWFH